VHDDQCVEIDAVVLEIGGKQSATGGLDPGGGLSLRLGVSKKPDGGRSAGSGDTFCIGRQLDETTGLDRACQRVCGGLDQSKGRMSHEGSILIL
jgi:hypothetical protein